MTARRPLLLVCLLVLTSLLVIPAESDEGPAASRSTSWSVPTWLEIYDSDASMMDMALDSNDTMNLVWVENRRAIHYARFDFDGRQLCDKIWVNTTFVGGGSWPHIAIGPDDDVHITWLDMLPGDPPTYVHPYIRMTQEGEVLASRPDAGGEDIEVDGKGFVHVYEFQRYINKSVEPEHSTLIYKRLNDLGSVLVTRAVGLHNSTTKVADFVVTQAGEAGLVFLHNRTTLNFSRFDSAGSRVVGEVPLVQGIESLLRASLTMDGVGNAHIAYVVDGGEPEVHYVSVGPTGSIVVAPKPLWSDDPGYSTRHNYRDSIEIVGPNRTGSMMIVGFGVGEWEGNGGGNGGAHGGCGENFYLDILEVDMLGELLPDSAKHTGGSDECTGHKETSSVMDRYDNFHIIFNLGESTFPYRNIYHMETVPRFFIDLRTRDEDLAHIPEVVIENEPFWLNTTISNIGNVISYDFDVMLVLTDNGTVIDNRTMSLGENETVGVGFQMMLQDSTNLSIIIDPLSNIDANLSNNRADITVVVSRPDLYLSPFDISFSDIAPSVGETITISAEIGNRGIVDATAKVSFHDDIGGDITVGTGISIGPESSKVVETDWVATPEGLHGIYVVIEEVWPREDLLTLHDNGASRNFTVGSGYAPEIDILSPREDQTIYPQRFVVSGTATDLDEEGLTVEVSLDGGPWAKAVHNADDAWFVEWEVMGLEDGTHWFTARVLDDIHVANDSVPFHYSSGRMTAVNRTPSLDPVIYEGENMGFHIEAQLPDRCVPRFTWSIDGTVVPGVHANVFTFYSTLDDAGTYIVEVWGCCVGDPGGPLTSWDLTVLDLNNVPTIDHASPASPAVALIDEGELELAIDASDLDQEILDYEWYINGTKVDSDLATLVFKPIGTGTYVIQAVVIDERGGRINMTWTVEVIEDPNAPDGGNGDADVGAGWAIPAMVVALVIVIIVVVLLLSARWRGRMGGSTEPAVPLAPEEASFAPSEEE
jgi:hypothetical protein